MFAADAGVMEKVGFRGLMWSRDEEFQGRKIESDGRCAPAVDETFEGMEDAARVWIANDVWTHISVDVQRHVGSVRVCSLPYDVSEKHFETNLHAI